MIVVDADADARRDAVGDLAAKVKQDVGAEALAVRSPNLVMAVVDRRAEQVAEFQAVTRPYQVLGEVRRPGQAGIGVVGGAGRVDLDPGVKPWMNQPS